MRKKYIPLFFSLLFIGSVAGQKEKVPLYYGIKAGMTRSTIKDVETTILSEPYFINYTLTSRYRMGWTGGGYINYKFHDNVSLESDIMYVQQGGDLEFNNIEKDFNYRMQFGYQYINFSGRLKLYPWGNKNPYYDPGAGLMGINIHAGPQLGLNIASQNIIYTSGGTGRLAAFGSDLEQQQQLRNVLKGKTNFGFSFGLGYEFGKFGLVIDARYFMGLTDVIETLPNSYNFIENKNSNKAFQFTLGWDFSFFNKESQ